ncbi:hypothetical protein P175DRAFT_0535188 [Aspergillus ochraceoroseus IBT 24754]|uniref:Uncharacterized protein n=1 Tax=Aspergillus ochraceoroseus IBT 24754 TaxID=1392256 RepID=A0A2T5LPR3_9EURO|nr:uncharacterized protein P175DRAFT_0535188 [Aspergillus ochraceoroseus IBT 24754]PTU18274.1 hypothetical protein P175DRAFT_0535188 [Aspergillus ochraceoroseus IBT 24754]
MAVPRKACSADDDTIPCNQQECPNIEQVLMERSSLSARPGSFDTSSSNDSSFFNALRATSSNDLIPPAGSAMRDSLDSRVAANVAMFFSLSSDITGNFPQPQRNRTRRNMGQMGNPRTHFLSHGFPQSITGEGIGGSLPTALSQPHVLAEDDQPRKVVSLNDADDISRPPKWPQKIKSPMSPTLPRYPPPIRSPTPPGLPSFGTQEALSYASQFPVQSSTRRGNNLQNVPAGSNSASRKQRAQESRPVSYGELLRRLFGIPSTNPSAPNNRQVCLPARAEDGTAVLGRFPYRQSGHGTNASRRIHDHPFHRRNLSVAQYDGADAEDNSGLSRKTYAMEQQSNQHPPFGPVDVSSSDAIPGTYPPGTPGPSPAMPRPTLVRRDAVVSSPTPILRADSYHTCASDVPEGTPSHITGQEAMHADNTSLSGCFLAPTQSLTPITTPNQPNRVHNGSEFVLQCLKIADSILCCGIRDTPEDPMYSNTSSHDTYVTAHGWVPVRAQPSRPSAEAQDQPRPTEA